ncbi:F-box protein SKIP23-like [Silene latifolia]|uniref:F-box protein SKIP23-like n=1 Tax=Silene latifolia TaxID=37657 RepID=UPI003D789A8E
MCAQKRAALANSWSDLPQEIISKIETRLDSAVDLCRLHSVCKNWHYARNPNHRGLLCPFLPRIIANNNLPFTDRHHEPVILVARAVFLVKPRGYPPPSCGWLLTVEEMVPGKLRILYPLSKDRVQHLPSNCPKFLDFTKFKVSQVDKSYSLKYESDDTDVPDVCRVILCSKSSVMVLYGGGILIRMKLKSGSWSFVRHSIISSFSDVISYGGNHVRAIESKGIVRVIDHRAAKVVKTISPKSRFIGFDKIYSVSFWIK